ncbi:hypothetical protein V5P93_005125 [Actinokineospora auranticolor]|uniref:Uncharacterized protein n=1 Tax=Actinokineospora auranticolor TaxID=155976 RepID=A0A2S6GKJ1_9PSEU|nr:hypothetical protein [Actinokineospora auranticolor]PPK65656.1 hypothetical protein CLV40_113140 [Actinokineospora auranticolor]
MSATRKVTASVLITFAATIGFSLANQGTAAAEDTHWGITTTQGDGPVCPKDTHWSTETLACVEDTHW